MKVRIICKCGNGISYDPSSEFFLTCRDCNESYSAWPTMFDKDGREMPRFRDIPPEALHKSPDATNPAT